MMEQLLLHLFGDYLLQNDWMSANKKKTTLIGELACQIHCITYSLPFLYIGTFTQVLLIYFSHYIIDRSNFVKWFMKNTGKQNFSKAPMAPWSIIVVDNTFHLIINYFILHYSG